MALSGGAVVALMHLAGFPSSQWRIGAAIAYQESSWNPTNTSANPDSKDLGLWQINDKWHPVELAMGDWRNPLDNTRMAYKIWKDQGWKPWVAYTSGAYTKHWSKADQGITEHSMAHRAANENAEGGSSTVDNTLAGNSGVNIEPVSGANPLEPLERIGSAIKILTSKDTWIRLGMFTSGALLVAIGAMWLVRNSKTIKAANKEVLSLVTDIIPQGKVAKVAAKGGTLKNAAVNKVKEGVTSAD